MCVYTTSSGTKVLATKIQGDLDFGPLHVEAYHLAELLGYSQQHSIRKQVLTDWSDIFEEGIDYRLVHDEYLLRRYESLHEEFVGPIRSMKAERGRMFLTPSGLRKVFWHSSKEVGAIKEALASLLEDPVELAAAPRAHLVVEPEGAGSDRQLELDALERQRQYEILEQLLDHLRHVKEPSLRRLALMSAEVGLGRRLGDIRQFLKLEEEQLAPRADPPAPEPAVVDEDPVPRPGADRDQLAREYLANRPFTQGPVFARTPGTYYGFKQIGEKAGGYTAVQAGKAADIVASRMGYTHSDIRHKNLPFNQLPELPDNTSGKLRKMYRFNADFANHVIVELRMNEDFRPGRPPDLGPFGQGGGDLPKLSRGPFDE